MSKQIKTLIEKILEAQKEIKNEKSEISYVFNKALDSVLLTIDEIQNDFKVGEYYFFYDDFKKQDGFIYGQLVEIDLRKEHFLRYCVQLPYGTITYWYSAISKELPTYLLKPLND